MDSILLGLRIFGNTVLENPLFLGISILVLINLILIIFVIILSRRITKLTRGKSGATLEQTIRDICDAVNEFDDWRDSATDMFKHIDTRLQGSVRGTSLVRFNPFKGTGSGGNQSFSAAFVDEKGNGVVVSSLYSRERVSLFGKPLENFASTFELTDEEKQAVKEAKNKLS